MFVCSILGYNYKLITRCTVVTQAYKTKGHAGALWVCRLPVRITADETDKHGFTSSKSGLVKVTVKNEDNFCSLLS